jgi:hypothetical protein
MTDAAKKLTKKRVLELTPLEAFDLLTALCHTENSDRWKVEQAKRVLSERIRKALA